MLTSGMVPALYADDEKEAIVGQVSRIRPLYRKASFRGAPSAHPDWIVPSVDE